MDRCENFNIASGRAAQILRQLKLVGLLAPCAGLFATVVFAL